MKRSGIANSSVPEAEGVFLARDVDEAEWFVAMGRGRGEAIDVWEVTFGEDFDCWDPPDDLPFAASMEGSLCHTDTIAPSRLRLLP